MAECDSSMVCPNTVTAASTQQKLLGTLAKPSTCNDGVRALANAALVRAPLRAAIMQRRSPGNLRRPEDPNSETQTIPKMKISNQVLNSRARTCCIVFVHDSL